MDSNSENDEGHGSSGSSSNPIKKASKSSGSGSGSGSTNDSTNSYKQKLYKRIPFSKNTKNLKSHLVLSRIRDRLKNSVK